MAKDMDDLSAVVESVHEVKTAFEAFKSAAGEREKELLTKGAVDALLEEKLKRINDDITKHQDLLDRYAAAQKRVRVTVDGKEMDVADLDAKALAWAQMCAKARGTQVSEFGHSEAKEYGKAFVAYLRKDDRILSVDEQKALSVGSDPDGGYVVSPDMSGRIVQKQFETSPVRQYASVQVISTDVLEGMFDLNEAGYGWVGETGSRVETSTAEIGKWRIPVHEMYAMPEATQKIVDDAYIDMEAWLAGKIADKFTRAENDAFVNGNGTNKPRGFLTYAAGTTLPGTIQQYTTAANGAFAADPNGLDKLISMVYGLKASYRANGTWFMNRTTQGGVRLLQDSNGMYQWQPSAQAGQPATLLGYPVATFDDMPDYTTTDALAIAFGDMREAYQIVDRIGVRVLRDPYTNKPYIRYYTTKRVGGDVVNFEALKLLKFGS